MKHIKQALSFLLVMAFTSTAWGQAVDILEKDHGISRKSRKGYLGQIVQDETNGTFQLIYILKPTRKTIPYEIYTFDKDLNLVDTKKEEDELERLRTKWTWFKFRGETYETKSVYARTNMKSELVLRQKNISWKWSWLLGGYSRKVTTGAKIKPTNEAGDKYEYTGGYYDNDDEGNVLVPVYDKGTNHSSAHVLRIDGEGAVKDVAQFSLPKFRTLVFSSELEGEANGEKRDWILLYAAGKGNKDAETAYTYIRLSSTGALLEQKDISVNNAPWRIIGAIQKNKEVYFYGPSINKDKYSMEVLGNIIPTTTSEDAQDDKSGNVGTMGKALLGSGAKNFGTMKALATGEAFMQTQDEIDTRLDELKYSNFQIAKIVGDQMVYISNPSVKEINQAVVTPLGQKKQSEFDGKRFITTSAQVLGTKHFLISGQDYTLDRSGANKGSHLYKDLFLLQFDESGKYLRNYGVQLERKKYLGQFTRGMTPDMFPASSMLIPSTDKSKVYWMIGECKAIDTDTDIESNYNYTSGVTTTTISTTQGGLYTVQYGVIDPKAGTASEFKVLGDDEKRNYYLFPNLNAVTINGYLIFLSETTKGDRILLSRFDLNK
jgi:hypothetical protein